MTARIVRHNGLIIREDDLTTYFVSYGLYVQQFGRALRTSPGKTHGIIIDHVDNVTVHKLPE